MSGIHVGRKKWADDPTQLKLRPFENTAEDLAALARVHNTTLRTTTLPEDFHELSPREIQAFYDRGGFSLAGNAWLMFLGVEPVAAAIVYPMAAFPDLPPGNFHLYVVPQFSQHGLGSRLLAHLERAAAHMGYPVLEATIAREDARSTAFLEARGFAAVGRSVQLSRSLGEAPRHADVPEGFRITSLEALGEPAGLYVQTANRLGAYDSSFTLVTPESVELEESAGVLEPRGILFLIDPTDRISGMIRARTISPGRARLSEVCLEPGERGKGYATSLVLAALGYAASAGARRAELEAPGGTGAAHSLALRTGFSEVRHWLHFLKRLATEADDSDLLTGPRDMEEG